MPPPSPPPHMAAASLIVATCLLLVGSARAAELPHEEATTDSYHHQRRHLNLHHHQPQPNYPLQVHKIPPTPGNTTTTITCNDGSQIGYYARLNSKSRSWIIYLQGGGFCASEESCQQRWQRNPQLMSSNYWPKTRTADGILSGDPQQNPHLWSANHVFVPYCSSDSWTGFAAAAATSGSFAFMGSRIVERVLESLYDDWPRESSLHGARQILLAGDSAGATGVLLNLDRVSELVAQRASAAMEPAPMVRGLADSGWFLDNEPFQAARYASGDSSSGQFSADGGHQTQQAAADCDTYPCSPLQSIRRAMLHWNGQVPESCARDYPGQPWRCYFGYRAYQTLKTPLFVVQWLYDEAQLMADNISRPDSVSQWNYIRRLVNEMRASLENVTALFAPSCFAHSLINKQNWNQISIDGHRLAQVLQSWQEQPATLPLPLPLPLPPPPPPPPPALVQSSTAPLNVEENTTGGLQQAANSQLYSTTGQFRHHHPQQRHSSAGSTTNTGSISGANQQQQQQTNRPRNRKRKRNNHQQRNKQARPRSSPGSLENPKPDDPTNTGNAASKESNELISTVNPLQDLLPLIDRLVAPKEAERPVRETIRASNSETSSSAISSSSSSSNNNNNNNRSGRSTLVDDSTVLLSNNVPEDSSGLQLSAGAHLEPTHRLDSKWSWPQTQGNNRLGADRFRLVDLCDWPQCNRDCPISDSDLFILGGLIQF